jgi:hypothetical protein
VSTAAVIPARVGIQTPARLGPGLRRADGPAGRQETLYPFMNGSTKRYVEDLALPLAFRAATVEADKALEEKSNVWERIKHWLDAWYNWLNEDWSREIKYDAATGEWVIATHKMCFGDVNSWVVPKASE